MEISNAKVREAYIGFEGHGLLCVCLTFEQGHFVQGPGAIGSGASTTAEASEPFMVNFIRAVLLALGIDDWSKAKGQYCRIKRDSGRIVAVGHIIEDKWLTFVPFSYTAARGEE